MPAKKPTKAPDINAGFYQGTLDVSFDCCGSDQCAFARFYVDPHGPDDDCCFRSPGGNCQNAVAHLAALAAMNAKFADFTRRLASEMESGT